MAKKSNGTKTYVLTLCNGGERHVTVPAHWKMTFGQLVPYAVRKGLNNDVGPAALRFYEGTKENLRGVMTDVVAIRDAKIIVSEYTQDQIGTRKAGSADKAYYNAISGEDLNLG